MKHVNHLCADSICVGMGPAGVDTGVATRGCNGVRTKQGCRVVRQGLCCVSVAMCMAAATTRHNTTPRQTAPHTPCSTHSSFDTLTHPTHQPHPPLPPPVCQARGPGCPPGPAGQGGWGQAHHGSRAGVQAARSVGAPCAGAGTHLLGGKRCVRAGHMRVHASASGPLHACASRVS